MIGYKQEYNPKALDGKMWFGMEDQERSLTDEEKIELLKRMAESANRIAQELQDKYQYARKHHGGTEL